MPVFRGKPIKPANKSIVLNIKKQHYTEEVNENCPYATYTHTHTHTSVYWNHKRRVRKVYSPVKWP